MRHGKAHSNAGSTAAILFVQAAEKRWEEDCISACLGHKAKVLADVKRS